MFWDYFLTSASWWSYWSCLTDTWYYTEWFLYCVWISIKTKQKHLWLELCVCVCARIRLRMNASMGFEICMQCKHGVWNATPTLKEKSSCEVLRAWDSSTVCLRTDEDSCFCCCWWGVPQMRTLGVTQCIQLDSDMVSGLKRGFLGGGGSPSVYNWTVTRLKSMYF